MPQQRPDRRRPAGCPIAGVAWAPDRGISKVEVPVDGGDWQPATLSAPISKATWVQWLVAWDAAAAGRDAHDRGPGDGRHRRRPDGRPDRRPPPDGARGHHAIQVQRRLTRARRRRPRRVPLRPRPVQSSMMTRRLFVFDPPDRFVAGTVGEPGNRTFFLQARRGRPVVSVVLEKVQVAVLAERLGVLLDELERRGIERQSHRRRRAGPGARSTSRSTRPSGRRR